MKPNVTPAMAANQNSGFSGCQGFAVFAAPSRGVGTAWSSDGCRDGVDSGSRYRLSPGGDQVVDWTDTGQPTDRKAVSWTYSSRAAVRSTPDCRVWNILYSAWTDMSMTSL